MKTVARLTSVLALGAVVMAVTMGPGLRAQVGAPRAGAGGITPAQARGKVDDIADDLRQARAAAGRIGDRAVRSRVEGLIRRAEQKARDLSEELARSQAARAQAPPTPLAAADFEKLLKGLKAENFDDGKLTFIQNFVAKAPLTCEQAAALLKAFSFDDKRIDALKAIYPKLVDPHNLNEVLAVYSFSSSRAEARKAVGLK
ncbi:MAG: DUF4476 domain-containing protein [Isosphaeraceae bacterium]